MKIYFYVIIIILANCNTPQNTKITYNPLQPDTLVNTEKLLQQGFEFIMKCDGGYNTYFKQVENCNMYFFEYCNKPGEIIGYTYTFVIDSTKNKVDIIDDTIVEYYKKSINRLLQPYGGFLAGKISLTNNMKARLNISNNKGIDFIGELYISPDSMIVLSIENWY